MTHKTNFFFFLMKSEHSEENLNFAERKLVRVKEREKDRDMESDTGTDIPQSQCAGGDRYLAK